MPKRAIIESCEVRRMFITYQVDGTSAADTISISISGNSIISVVNGVSDSASDIINNTIEINGFGGSDTISIVASGNNTLIINAGNGDDTINMGIGANNLAAINEPVTINGDSGSDSIIFFDTANTTDTLYTMSGGNQFTSTFLFQGATVNAELIDIRGGNAKSTLSLLDPPNAPVLFNGAGGTNSVIASGTAGETIGCLMGSSSGGTLHYPLVDVTFVSAPDVRLLNYGSATITTSALNETVTVDNSAANVVDIDTNAVTTVKATNVGTITFDLSSNNASDTDVLNFNGAAANVANGLFNVDMGGGTNTINVNHNYNINTRVGFAGGQFNDIVITGATATFQGLQTPKSLAVRNNGTAAFTGTGQVLATPSLQVPSGVGNININTGQTGVVSSSFVVGGTGDCTKKGAGTLTINSSVVQGHATTATITGGGGTFSINNDCGSAALRKVNAVSRGGTLLFNASQHLKSVFADTGVIRLAPFGARAIVTDNIGVNTDTGGAIDLTNNNLIFDYPAGPTQVNTIRDLLTSGYAGGNWNGVGLMSTVAQTATNTALGYADAPELFSTFPASFAGETIDSSSVVVRHTFYGDTNLDRVVNFDDLLVVAQQYGPTVGGKSWSRGNFNYNTPDNVQFATGFDDLLLLAQNYELSASTGRSGIAKRDQLLE